MTPSPEPSPVVFSLKARCRDCHRCLRMCPVKAIRIHDGQASVVSEFCIACGTCIRECPQHAKTYRTDLERAIELASRGGLLAASLAPSFASVLQPWERSRIASALRKLGFCYVGETALGAAPVAKAAAEHVLAHPDQPHLWTSCPAVVQYIESYQSDLIDSLVPVTSPMIAHARHIKQKLGAGARVVFIGPCVAKKAEAQRPENAGAVDCVLTFEELFDWLAREHVTLRECEESDFDETPEPSARVYPVEGGSLRTAAMPTDLVAAQVLSASGFDEVRLVLEGIRQQPRALVAELLMCPHGCINGPALARDTSLLGRRCELLQYASRSVEAPRSPWSPVELGMRAHAVAGGQTARSFSEEEIQGVLEKTGKARREDQLDCGACGYPSCRAKAIAVLGGMAEPAVCIPVMRRLAEQRSDRILDTSPNGIVILDAHLNILNMNPAFRSFFACSQAMLGKHISLLMDPEPFQRLAAASEPKIELTVRHERFKLVCHQILYALSVEQQYVGIFVNITRHEAERESLEQLRRQTLAQGQELLDHQIRMAQHIAKFLGESTAKGEMLVENLLKIARDPSADSEQGTPNKWLWDIYTSK